MLARQRVAPEPQPRIGQSEVRLCEREVAVERDRTGVRGLSRIPLGAAEVLLASQEGSNRRKGGRTDRRAPHRADRSDVADLAEQRQCERVRDAVHSLGGIAQLDRLGTTARHDVHEPRRHARRVAPGREDVAEHDEARSRAFPECDGRLDVRVAIPVAHHDGRRNGAQRTRAIEIRRQEIDEPFAPERVLALHDVERRDGDAIVVDGGSRVHRATGEPRRRSRRRRGRERRAIVD